MSVETTTVTSAFSLTRRSGPLPTTTKHNPQQQLDQIPAQSEYDIFRRQIEAWPNVIKAPSMRAPHGTVGLYLSPSEAKGSPAAFLLSTEFAHLHPLPDGSLHMVLPTEAHSAAIQAGWGIPHPMAGMPSVSPQTILIFAPRDAAEREVVASLIAAAEGFARGGI